MKLELPRQLRSQAGSLGMRTNEDDRNGWAVSVGRVWLSAPHCHSVKKSALSESLRAYSARHFSRQRPGVRRPYCALGVGAA